MKKINLVFALAIAFALLVLINMNCKKNEWGEDHENSL